jgi:hypothetical protein
VTTLLDPSTADTLVAEIAQRFGDVGMRKIVECLDRAQHDLDGSVSAEALPEMSLRLAIFRLEAMSEHGAA